MMDGKNKRYRLDIRNDSVRLLYDEYKKLRNIPYMISLTDAERADFELWAISEAEKRGLDIFGCTEYRTEILRVNKKIMNRYNKR